MKLFGHPVHPLIIHFPTALIPLHTVLAGVSYYSNDPSFIKAGYYSLIGGVMMGLVAVITGLLELFSLPKNDQSVLISTLYHGSLNGIVIGIFAIILYREYNSYPAISIPSVAKLITECVLILLLFIGNYFGGNLIYKYHIGINLKDHVNRNSA